MYQLDHPLEGTKGFVQSFLEELAKFQKYCSISSVMTISQEAAHAADNIHKMKVDFNKFLSKLSDILSSSASAEFRKVAALISLPENPPQCTQSPVFAATAVTEETSETEAFLTVRGDYDPRNIQEFRQRYVDSSQHLERLTPKQRRLTNEQRDKVTKKWSPVPLEKSIQQERYDSSPRHPSRREKQKTEYYQQGSDIKSQDRKNFSRLNRSNGKHDTHSSARGSSKELSGTSDSEASGLEENNGDYSSDGQYDPDFTRRILFHFRSQLHHFFLSVPLSVLVPMVTRISRFHFLLWFLPAVLSRPAVLL